MIKYAKLQIQPQVELIKQELGTINTGWLPHLNKKHYAGEWSVIALKAPGGDAGSISADLLGETSYAATPLFKHFPSVQQLLGSMECETMSVRLLNLQAGSLIKEHRDHELSFENGECRLHFPIVTNDEVYFYVDNERLLMNEGECWYINANLPHKVENKSNTDRIHLVVDCKVNEWLTDLLEKSENKKSIKAPVNKDLENIIRELILQNTPTSLSLASNLQKQLDEQ